MKAGGVALGMTVRLGRSPDIARIAKATGPRFHLHRHAALDLRPGDHRRHRPRRARHRRRAAGARAQRRRPRRVAAARQRRHRHHLSRTSATPPKRRKAVDYVQVRADRQALGGRAAIPTSTTAPCRSPESVPQLNDACLLVCMIETVEGLENVREDRAAVERRRCAARRQQRPARQHGQARQVRRSGHRGGRRTA